jgi:hypothetical protein
VRAEINRTGQPAINGALEPILQRRDVVTPGIAKKDPATIEVARKTNEDFTPLAGNL